MSRTRNAKTGRSLEVISSSRRFSETLRLSQQEEGTIGIYERYNSDLNFNTVLKCYTVSLIRLVLGPTNLSARHPGGKPELKEEK